MARFPFLWPFLSSLFFACVSMGFAIYMAWLANRRTTQAKADAERREEQIAIEQERLKASHAVLDRLENLDKQLEVLQVKIAPFWAAAQTKIAKDLTHPSEQFHEMDALLRKLEALEITTSDRTRLHTLLQERSVSVDAEVTDMERKKALIMIQLMDVVIDEAAAPPGDRAMSMVIPPASQAPEESAGSDDKAKVSEASQIGDAKKV